MRLKIFPVFLFFIICSFLVTAQGFPHPVFGTVELCGQPLYGMSGISITDFNTGDMGSAVVDENGFWMIDWNSWVKGHILEIRACDSSDPLNFEADCLAKVVLGNLGGDRVDFVIVPENCEITKDIAVHVDKCKNNVPLTDTMGASYQCKLIDKRVKIVYFEVPVDTVTLWNRMNLQWWHGMIAIIIALGAAGSVWKRKALASIFSRKYEEKKPNKRIK